MTKQNYDALLRFAGNMISTQLSYLNYSIMNAHDFVSEAFIIGFASEKCAKKIICDLIYQEKYRTLAVLQRNVHKQHCGSKVCRSCKKDKPLAEFQKAFDKRYGLHYYRYKCKECTAQYYKSDAFKTKRKVNYQSNPLARKKAIQRAIEWNKQNRPWQKLTNNHPNGHSSAHSTRLPIATPSPMPLTTSWRWLSAPSPMAAWKNAT